MSVNHAHVNDFVESLRVAKTEDSDLVNIYDDEHDSGGWRRERLRRFLTIPRDGHPLVLFVGEAPGVHGAAVTGVPFCSVETLTATGFERLHPVNTSERFASPLDAEPELTERTANRFWTTVLSEFEDKPLPLPVAWNIMPFWPTKDGGNRTPNANDIRFGATWIESLFKLFPTEYVVGVGTKSRDALDRSGLLWDWVYHPARRLTDFNEGVRRVAQRVRKECAN